MGDFSRDTFRLTNVMHQVLSGGTVADPRHYVAVRTQQGVPVLDADVNEAADIGRFAAEIQLRHFFGDGVPAGSDGFRIGPVTEDNDFSIGAGMALVGGVLVFNPHAGLTYATQAAVLGFSGTDVIGPPNTGTRDDLVYLDVWEEEVASAGSDRADDRLVHPAIGVETCTRIERRWRVRVAPGVTEIAAVPVVAGHLYLPLARLRRSELEPRIFARRILELRRTDLNVARYLKVPVQASREATVVDSRRMADLLDALRTALLDRLAGSQLFVPAAEPARTLLLFALQHVLQLCSSGALQARTQNLGNADALEALVMLREGQAALVEAADEHGVAGTDLDAFVTGYTERLAELEAETDDEDLVGAYEAQQEINGWLATVSDTLPEGTVTLQYLSVAPFTPLAAGQPYVFTIEFASAVTAQDSTEEIFDVVATLSSDLWQIDRESDEITLNNNGGTGTLQFTVTPHAANATCTLTISAEARRNPLVVRTSQPGLALQLGQRPAVGATLLYAGPSFDPDDGRLEVPAAALAGFGQQVAFALANRTDAQHTYRVRYHVTLSGGVNPAGWLPAAGAPQASNFVAPAQTIHPAVIAISGPAVAGNTGTIHATLIQIDGGNLPPDQQETLLVPFRAV